jgi:hypothetical protein
MRRFPVIFLAFFIVAVGALSVTVAARRDHAADPRFALGVAFCASLGAIFTLTLHSAPGPNELQLVPLVHTIGGLRPPIRSDVPFNVGGNIGLFLPFGAALCLLGLRRRTAVLTGLCLSTLIEITQLFIPGRTTSTDDVLCNTLGAVLGYVLLSRWAPPAGFRRRASP